LFSARIGYSGEKGGTPMLKAHFLAAIALAAILPAAALAAAAQEETAAEVLDQMIAYELEIGRALAQSPTGARRSERWRRWRADHDAELSILLALRREGADLGSVEELFNEYRRRGIEAGVSTIWQPDRDPGE
jgi:hypothetical protein